MNHIFFISRKEKFQQRSQLLKTFQARVAQSNIKVWSKKIKEVRWNSEEMLAGYQIERQICLDVNCSENVAYDVACA